MTHGIRISKQYSEVKTHPEPIEITTTQVVVHTIIVPVIIVKTVIDLSIAIVIAIVNAGRRKWRYKHCDGLCSLGTGR